MPGFQVSRVPALNAGKDSYMRATCVLVRTCTSKFAAESGRSCSRGSGECVVNIVRKSGVKRSQMSSSSGPVDIFSEFGDVLVVGSVNEGAVYQHKLLRLALVMRWGR